jgi:hypothetical protein
MEVENLELDDFDINTHEPPNYNTDMLSIERIEGVGDDAREEDYDEEYSDEEYTDDDNEELSDGDMEISLNEENENGEIDFEEFDNVIYSYPFFSKDGIDYEYRVTITDEELLLEQVKCDDNQADFNECVEVFAEIYRGELIPTFEIIQNNQDLRDKTTVLQEGIIDYNFDECGGNTEGLKQKIENNKQSVLFELYKEIVDSVYQ